jgi:hypothetical protein
MQAAIPVAFQAGGALLEGIGRSQAYRHQEDRAERLAAAARTAADQTDAHLRDELITTLGNISAIRAAAGASSDSPTSIAIMDNERDVSERQRRTRVGNLRGQAAQYDRDAEYFGSASRFALGVGAFNAFNKGFAGVVG